MRNSRVLLAIFALVEPGAGTDSKSELLFGLHDSRGLLVPEDELELRRQVAIFVKDVQEYEPNREGLAVYASTRGCSYREGVMLLGLRAD